ncbi:hypothetical protein ENINMM108B2_23730 [Enterobacter intestinihominis]
MFVFLVIPILVSGFLLVHIHPIYKYKLHRYEGQFLYLKSAQYGLYSMILGVVFFIYTSGSLSIPYTTISFDFINFIHTHLNFINSINQDKKLLDELSIIFSITIFTLFFPIVWTLLSFIRLFIKYRTFDIKPYIMSRILNDSPLDKFLLNASISKNKDDAVVMLTMQDRKVYVGNVITTGEPSETEGPDQEIEFIPWISGFRHKDTLTVTFTTDYKILKERITLILKQEEILSATSFSFKHYEEFEKRKAEFKKNKLKDIIKILLDL